MRYKAVLIVVLGMVLAVLGYVGLAHAQTAKSDQTVTVAHNQIVDNTLFATGRTLDIAGTVNGDIFCAGQSITITGTVHGDVMCAGQDVRVAATVDGSVRLAGQNVSLGGTVAKNASVAAQSVSTDGNSKVGEDLMITASDVSLDGSIGRDIGVNGNHVTISSSVGRDVSGTVNNLVIASGAAISGNVTYRSANQLNTEKGAQIKGKVQHLQPSSHLGYHYNVFAVRFVWGLYLFVSLLVAAVVLALLFPRLFHDATERAQDRPLRTFLFGLGTAILGPVIFIALMVTLIGIPLGILFILAWLLAMLVSGPAFGYFIGRYILPHSQHASLIMLVGAAILYIVYFIPILGFLAWLATVLFGSGILVSDLFYHTPKPAHPVR